MILQLTEEPKIIIRDKFGVIIFPSRPYWFSASPAIKLILDLLVQEVEESSLLHELKSTLSCSEQEVKDLFYSIKELLFKNGVLLIDGKMNEDITCIKPSFQVNKVENVLVIATTNECNLDCPHCYPCAGTAFKKEMSTEEIKNIIDQLDRMPWKNEVSNVSLTGGELFTRSDAWELINYAHCKDFKVIVSSNGTLLTDDLISKIASLKNFKISVSLDGPNKEVHEKVRGKNTFQITVDNLQKLVSKGVYTGVNMFVYDGNIEYVESTLALASSLGVNAFNCLNLMNVGRANSKKNDNISKVPEVKLNRILFDILRNNKEYQKLMQNSTFANQIMGISAGVKSHYCGIGTNRALYVKPDGGLYPCPDTAIPKFFLGNILNQKLSDIWDNSSILSDLRTLNVDTMNDVCNKCEVRYFCGGNCRGENYQVSKK